MTITIILVTALAVFINGFLWHGPMFGKLWMKLANIHPTGNEKLSDMYGKMFWNYVVNVITVGIMFLIFCIVFKSPMIGEVTWWKGILASLCVWFGFIFTGSSIEVIWMDKSWKLWLFECASSAVGFVIIGLILSIWR